MQTDTHTHKDTRGKVPTQACEARVPLSKAGAQAHSYMHKHAQMDTHTLTSRDASRIDRYM